MLELFASDWRDLWGGAESNEPVGAVFTRCEIVELILDIAGYTPRRTHLASKSLLEPSCGDGAFLAVVIRRLIESESIHVGEPVDWCSPHLEQAIRAADISAASVDTARTLAIATLCESGCPAEVAESLARSWVVQTDFLLNDWPNQFDFVVGNPPYVRIEDVPRRVLSRYRERFSTTTDRADLYVAFLERGLQLVSTSGTLAFICANRFAKNKYGEALRRLLGQKYHVRCYINLEHTQPFLTEVSAYPAIIVVDRAIGEPTRAATLEDIKPETIATVRSETLASRRPRRIVSQFASWYSQGEPWITTSAEEHNLLDSLNSSFPTLEHSAPGTRVGIGVATGADNVFVLKHKHLDIEESRQIPLIMAADIGNDALRWSGHYLLNPFADSDDGSLANLRDFPGFAAHLANSTDQLKARHVAKTRLQTWYRTIDRIWPALMTREKLVIPDIQSATLIGLDAGNYYPHHNLYWITSESWPLAALKALLRSSVVFQQVKAYSVQMRGGSVRFQAQTLRRVRIPELQRLPNSIVVRLAELSTTFDQEALDEVARRAYASVAKQL